MESKAETPRSGISRVLAYRNFWLLVLVTLGSDQLTKHWISAQMPLGTFRSAGTDIIPGFLNLAHVGNPGAAWSMFLGKSTELGLLAAATLVAIFYWRKHLSLKTPMVQVGFGMLCGGIVGNLVDRLQHGYVVDFIDVHYGSYNFPTFNVADSGIFIGVCCYVLWSLKNPQMVPQEK